MKYFDILKYKSVKSDSLNKMKRDTQILLFVPHTSTHISALHAPWMETMIGRKSEQGDMTEYRLHEKRGNKSTNENERFELHTLPLSSPHSQSVLAKYRLKSTGRITTILPIDLPKVVEARIALCYFSILLSYKFYPLTGN